MEFELPKINVSFEYDEEKDEIVFVINGVEKRVKNEDMITEMEKLQEQNNALEQQPCEDCISRKAVLDCFKKWQPYMATRIFEYEQELKALPSIQPKPKTDVLDKIRAEIIENSIEDYKYHGCGTDELIIETSEVLNILDKYKAESEDKE